MAEYQEKSPIIKGERQQKGFGRDLLKIHHKTELEKTCGIVMTNIPARWLS